jgi:heme-degrading monooxygenase HmoA
VAATNSVTRITAFDVPPEGDEAFLAGCSGAVVHRALRPDVRFRFVAVGPADVGGTGGAYELLWELGTPDVEGGAVRIELFDVPGDEDERFLPSWERLRGALAQQRGYLGTRLYRSMEPAPFRFVDFTRWSSPLMFARAQKLPDVHAAIEAMPYSSHEALYLVVRD